MNQTAKEIQRVMYHPLITFVNRQEEITCSCQQKTCFCIQTGVSNFVGFQVATDIFVALVQCDNMHWILAGFLELGPQQPPTNYEQLQVAMSLE